MGREEQERPNPPIDVERQGPGRRIEPVRVFQEQHRRSLAYGAIQQPPHQGVGVIGPNLAGQRQRMLVLGELERQKGVEERGLEEQVRVGLEAGEHPRASLTGRRQPLDVEELG